jgi:phosphotransferase system  glucose/maltose/N-acetylglucosamine-specific IIC component
MQSHVERYFVGTGVVLGIIGMILGIGMGIREDFTLVPVHSHLNLVGWVSLVLFGLCYRAGIAKADRWARAHFWIAATAAILFPVGIYIAATWEQPGLAIFGSLLALLSMILFLINVIRART